MGFANDQIFVHKLRKMINGKVTSLSSFVVNSFSICKCRPRMFPVMSCTVYDGSVASCFILVSDQMLTTPVHFRDEFVMIPL